MLSQLDFLKFYLSIFNLKIYKCPIGENCMAKEKIFFLVSFAVLGLVAAFLFREQEVSVPSTQINGIPQRDGSAKIEVLAAQGALKVNERLTPNKYTWETIDFVDYEPSLVQRTEETEKLLQEATAAKAIKKDAKIHHTDISWSQGTKRRPQLSIARGKRAVPLELSKRVGIVQFMHPGMYVNVIFNSKDSIGFGKVNLTLLENIRILAIGNDGEGNTPESEGWKFRSSLPVEILLEMTPKESEIFSYAESAGDITLEFLDGNEFQEKNDLQQMLFASESPGDFRSILVTYMVQTLFPDIDITVTSIPNGYIVTGKVPDYEKAKKIVEVLETIAAGGDEAVVNLIESNPPQNMAVFENHVFEEPVIEEEQTILPPAAGKIGILFDFKTTTGMIQSIEPGKLVDLTFSSKPDIGFGSVHLTLLKNIRVLAIDSKGWADPFGKGANFEQHQQPVQVLLEMTPREAEIFTFAQSSGILSLNLVDENSYVPSYYLSDQLSTSETPEDFRSILVTHMVRDLFPKVDIQITATTKGYVVSGKVSDPQKAEKIIEILEKLAPGSKMEIVNLMDVEPQQVLLCVKVFELSKEVSKHLGLNWKALYENNNGESVAFAAVFPRPAPGDPNYFFEASKIKVGDVTLSFILDMLQENNGGRILAEPNLTTVSGKPASFFAGGEFPILIPQGGVNLGTVTVEFKKFGVMLDFTPTVDLNGLITLHVVPEISTIDRSNAVVLAGFVIPSIVARKADTTVKLWPGQSYIIGGLLQNERISRKHSLYGLDRLPIIGPLFASKEFLNRQSELMIMVTPYLVSADRSVVEPIIASPEPPPPPRPMPRLPPRSCPNADFCGQRESGPVDFVETPWVVD
jgi:Flp pilus assembly protein CpaB